VSAEQEPLLIRLYGDSLSLPRHSDGIRFFDTYIELLVLGLQISGLPRRVSVLNRAAGAATITSLHVGFLRDQECLGRDAGGITIIQCGIVDCAPRPISPGVKSAIGRLPGPFRLPVVRLLHYARPTMLRAGLQWRYTELDDFRTQLDQWLLEAAGACERTYVINIAPTVPAIDRHSPGLSESIVAYNRCMAAAVTAATPGTTILVDANAAISATGSVLDYVSADGHHITPAGHRLYADLLLQHEMRRLDDQIKTDARHLA
jgi:hypothetical protein